MNCLYLVKIYRWMFDVVYPAHLLNRKMIPHVDWTATEILLISNVEYLESELRRQGVDPRSLL